MSLAITIPRPSTAAELRAAASVGLFYIGGRLGHRGRSERWLSRYVGQLIEHEGFPPALPLYKAGKKVETITGSTRWTRDAVDAWFDGFMPPALAAVHVEREIADHAATLDARAEAMAVGGLAGGADNKERIAA